MGKSKQQKRPRFRRQPDRTLRLQSRDHEIIRQVYKHRFLNSEQIAALATGSYQGVLRRLNLLFHNSYLDRPTEQIKPFNQAASPMVYGLGNKGADFLASKYGLDRAKIDWTQKNKGVRHAYLDHALLVSKFMVSLELAVKQVKNLKLIEQGTIVSNMKKKGEYNPLSWCVPCRISLGNKIMDRLVYVMPDRVFGLYFCDEPKSRNRSYFFLEADRATMPVKRNSVYSSSFQKKMIGYYESWKNSLFRDVFGFPSARVLTITKSHDRINNMINAGKDIDPRGKGLRLFLFLREKEINMRKPETLLNRIWRTGRGQSLVSLLD